MKVWVIPGILELELELEKTAWSKRARVVLPLDDGPEIPIIIALSFSGILFSVLSSSSWVFVL